MISCSDAYAVANVADIVEGQWSPFIDKRLLCVGKCLPVLIKPIAKHCRETCVVVIGMGPVHISELASCRQR